jgi:hypothetical protein
VGAASEGAAPPAQVEVTLRGRGRPRADPSVGARTPGAARLVGRDGRVTRTSSGRFGEKGLGPCACDPRPLLWTVRRQVLVTLSAGVSRHHDGRRERRMHAPVRSRTLRGVWCCRWARVRQPRCTSEDDSEASWSRSGHVRASAQAVMAPDHSARLHAGRRIIWALPCAGAAVFSGSTVCARVVNWVRNQPGGVSVRWYLADGFSPPQPMK